MTNWEAFMILRELRGNPDSL